MDVDPNIYMVADYYATGEGRTVMILITRAPTTDEDYEIKPSIDSNGYNPGKEKNTKIVRALREFIEKFGGYYGSGAQILNRHDFVSQYGNFIPDAVRTLTDINNKDLVPPAFHYESSIHLNFS
jgi:hypothetical protein